MPKLLVVDDDRSIRRLVDGALEPTDIEVVAVASAAEAQRAADEHRFEAALVDIMLGDGSGLQLFEALRERDARLPIVFITGADDSTTAIEAMKLGAFDYVAKPLDVAYLRELVQKAIHTHQMASVPVEMPASTTAGVGDALVGRSAAMLEVYKAIGQAAPENVSVLIQGESGTGKELVARAIYQHSRRAEKPFLAVNCAAIPENLLESELFGHEKGAFTGAASRRIGKFEQCDGGTLFLDEVGDMAPALQGKVLRILQEQRFERVGGNDTIQTDVRIIAATNRDLESLCEKREFRPDLYYRLNGFSIHLPPLRERGNDLRLLIEHLLARFKRDMVKKVDGFAPEALDVLTTYAWPGNVRELQSVIRQAMLQATTPLVTIDCLPEHVVNPAPTATDEPQGHNGFDQFITQHLQRGSNDLYAQSLELMERALLTRVLDHTNGNQSEASRLLGITRGSLRNKIRTHGISIERKALADDGG